jgi:hypothetical protein
MFFNCPKLKESNSTIEYMIKAILIHLDDQNEEVQRAIFETLRVAAIVDPCQLIKEVKTFFSKLRLNNH